MAEPPYEHRPLSGPRTIRLLRLKRAREEQREQQQQQQPHLSGELFEVSVDDESATRWEAVSYVRGPPGDAGIRISGRVLKIPPNCEEALTRLYLYRQEEEEKESDPVLWVDAVCINEQDVAEKSGQVGLTEEIYGRATRTTAWLGPGDDETDQVVAKLNAQRRHYEGGELSAEERRKYSPPNFPTRDGYCTRTYEFVHGLLGRAWFARAWTVQEASLTAGRKLELAVGDKARLGWDTLARHGLPQYVESPMPKGSRLDGLNLRAALARFRDIARGESSSNNNNNNNSSHTATAAARVVPLTDIFFSVKKLAATDPRDKVYALWWIARLSSAPLPAPDYAVPPVRVFARAAAACAAQDRSLGFLYMVSGKREEEGGRPSWVPDLGSRSTRWRYLFDVDKRAMEGEREADGERGRQRERNSEQEPERERESIPFTLDAEAGTLRLQGRILGTLSEDPVQMPRRYGRAELAGPSWDAAVDYVRTLRATMELLDAAGLDEPGVAAALVGLGGPPPTSPAAAAAAAAGGRSVERRARAWEEEWAAVLRRPDAEVGQGISTATFAELRAAHDAPSWRHKSSWLFEEVYAKDEGRALTGLAEFKRLVRLWFDWRVADVHQTVTGRLADNALFLVAGRFAMGPPATRRGDLLALFDGLCFPFVVRRDTAPDHYRLVGPAYVHRGVWPPGEMQNMVLI